MVTGSYDIEYTSGNNVKYAFTMTVSGKVEDFARAEDVENNDNNENPSDSQSNKIWANYFEGEGKLVYATTKDSSATESWDITNGLDIFDVPWGHAWVDAEMSEDDEDYYDEDPGQVEVDSEYQTKITKIVIKDELYPETTNYMFYELKNVTSIDGLDKLLNHIDEIGEYMFSDCGGLGNLDLSTKNITHIREGAFYAAGLTSIVLPNTLEIIEEDAFGVCKFESINIPDGVTEIGDNAFSHCWDLKEVNLPNTLTTIWEKAFSMCTSLKSITIPENVRYIGEGAFSGCEDLETINYYAIDASGTDFFYEDNDFDDEDEDNFMGEYLPFDDCEKVTVLNIYSGVKVIPIRMFAYLTKVESISLPLTVEKIEKEAFRGCSSLTEIEIPHSVTTIGTNTFKECDSLETIYVNNTVTAIQGDLLAWGAPSAEVVYSEV